MKIKSLLLFAAAASLSVSAFADDLSTGELAWLTNGDPAITRKLAEHGRNSVPLYLWYAPHADQPDILPQILTPAMLIARATAAQKAKGQN